MSPIIVPKQQVLITSTPLCFPDSTIQMTITSCSQLSGLIQQEICQHSGAFFPPVIQRQSQSKEKAYFVKCKDVFCDVLKGNGPSRGLGQHPGHSSVTSNGLCQTLKGRLETASPCQKFLCREVSTINKNWLENQARVFLFLSKQLILQYFPLYLDSLVHLLV